MSNFDLKYKDERFQLKLEEQGLYVIRYRDFFESEHKTESDAKAALEKLLANKRYK